MPEPTVLLLNASNMEAFPVFPYAFVQVPAIARSAGVKVVCRDLLGIPPARWSRELSRWIADTDPLLVFITLRNTDTLDPRNYDPEAFKGSKAAPYFPIEQTRQLIETVRAVSDLRIVVGGFGFSVMPQVLMKSLQPDLGVCGDADGFFDHFWQILQGEFAQVPNLLYFQGGELVCSPRRFYPPSATTEYTPQVIAEMMSFYETFPDPGFQGAAVEVVRGCCHGCVFCSEPHVKGVTVRYRDIPVVMSEIRGLVEHGITQLYLISSELNPSGNEYLLALAEAIENFNAGHRDGQKVSWFGANYLLNFTAREFETLAASRFTGGWFDITALEDDNARAMKTPYRVESLVPALKTFAACRGGRKDPGTASQDDPAPSPRHWTLFLGNPATTLETIRNTLRTAEREGLSQLFDSCSLNRSIRVFQYEDPDPATLAVTFSVNPDLQQVPYQEQLPSFAYPPALLQAFGSVEEISWLFDTIAETYLSTRYRQTRDWAKFFRENTNLPSLVQWLQDLEGEAADLLPEALKGRMSEDLQAALQPLFDPGDPAPSAEGEKAWAQSIYHALLASCLEAHGDAFSALGLPASIDSLAVLTPYAFAATIYARWSAESDLIRDVAEICGDLGARSGASRVRTCLVGLLYRYNFHFRPSLEKIFSPSLL